MQTSRRTAGCPLLRTQTLFELDVDGSADAVRATYAAFGQQGAKACEVQAAAERMLQDRLAMRAQPSTGRCACTFVSPS